MQAKLLRVLQEREVRPLGSRQAIPVDFRLVCATNRRLRDEVQLGRFREDLYYRISTIELTLPPLRERAQDIPELVVFLLRRMAEQMGRPVPELTRQALRKLMRCPWPGNVRQLENVLARAMVLAENDQITAPDIELPARLQPSVGAPGRDGFAARERERMLQALETNRWNVRQAAKLLGIPRPTFYRKLKRYGLDRSSPASGDR
jgi:DNA-binding NtrC family response regulator